MEEVEFVGHILKTDGFHFSSEKRSEVLDFPPPEKQKHLKSFLGLFNYFRDHVEGLSVLTKPLNDLNTPYKKSSSIMDAPAGGAFQAYPGGGRQLYQALLCGQ